MIKKISSCVLFALLAAGMNGSAAGAIIVAGWTFETDTPADLSNSTTSPIVAADLGIGTAIGYHASADTDWTTPVGNGSANSLSSNTWAIGDYYQFAFSLADYESAIIEWDQTGSNTGPRDFVLQVSIDGGASFSNELSYAVANNSWSTVAPLDPPVSTRSLALPSSTNGVANVLIRLTVDSGTAINNSGIQSGGTGRVDNITVSATAVPEPTSLLLLGSALAYGAFRRRR